MAIRLQTTAVSTLQQVAAAPISRRRFLPTALFLLTASCLFGHRDGIMPRTVLDQMRLQALQEAEVGMSPAGPRRRILLGRTPHQSAVCIAGPPRRSSGLRQLCGGCGGRLSLRAYHTVAAACWAAGPTLWGQAGHPSWRPPRLRYCVASTCATLGCTAVASGRWAGWRSISLNQGRGRHVMEATTVRERRRLHTACLACLHHWAAGGIEHQPRQPPAMLSTLHAAPRRWSPSTQRLVQQYGSSAPCR